jgi:hypothetical protein
MTCGPVPDQTSLNGLKTKVCSESKEGRQSCQGVYPPCLATSDSVNTGLTAIDERRKRTALVEPNRANDGPPSALQLVGAKGGTRTPTVLPARS